MPTVTPYPAGAGMADAARGAWAWWTTELRSMAPHWILRAQDASPRSDIRIGSAGVSVDRIADGFGERFHEPSPLDQLGDEGWAELVSVMEGTAPRLLLGAPDIFWTSVRLPAAARPRLRSAVALQLPQIAPIDSALLHWGARVVGGDVTNIDVAVAMIRIDRTEVLSGLFRSRGLPAPPMAAEVEGEAIEIFPGDRRVLSDQARLSRRVAVAAAVLLASIPFTTWAGAEAMTSLADARAEALQHELRPRLEAERRAVEAAKLNGALQHVFERPGAAETLEALALALPDTDHASAAARTPDGTLRLRIETADPEGTQLQLSGKPGLSAFEADDMSPLSGKPGRIQLSLRGEP